MGQRTLSLFLPLKWAMPIGGSSHNQMTLPAYDAGLLVTIYDVIVDVLIYVVRGL